MRAGRHSAAKKNRSGRTAMELVIMAALSVLLCFTVNKRAEMVRTEPPAAASTQPTKTEAPSATAAETPLPEFSPHFVDDTAPEKLLKSTGIMVDGTDGGQLCRRTEDDTIAFGQGEEYTDAQGIVTFRGNNFRDTAAYGTADIDTERNSAAVLVRDGQTR
jgi:hypothetical protein